MRKDWGLGDVRSEGRPGRPEPKPTSDNEEVEVLGLGDGRGVTRRSVEDPGRSLVSGRLDGTCNGRKDTDSGYEG